MGLFYAYLKHASDNEHNRHLITFANREVADEWWRIISTPPSPYAGHMKRTTPQFYVQISGNSILNFFDEARLPDARQFSEKMFFARTSKRSAENPTVISPTEVTDHISGQWYFIRSKADPWSHWYFCTDGACLVCGDANCEAIHVSSEYRTKFCIRVRNLADDFQVPENFVIIGKDEISITAPMDYTVHVNDAGNLRAKKGYQGEIDLLFGNLKNRFITRAEKQVNGEIWEHVVPVTAGLGESWELVD